MESANIECKQANNECFEFGIHKPDIKLGNSTIMSHVSILPVPNKSSITSHRTNFCRSKLISADTTTTMDPLDRYLTSLIGAKWRMDLYFLLLICFAIGVIVLLNTKDIFASINDDAPPNYPTQAADAMANGTSDATHARSSVALMWRA